MVQTAETIWRDFVTDGIPASGTQKPRKVDIREWAATLETGLSGLASNSGLVYQTRAELDANLNYPSLTMVWVVADPTAANNGIYQKLSASGSGSWLRLLDLPYSFIRATDAGAGTANAIIATSSLAIPVADAGALVALNIFEANTASPVTVAFNGGTALTIKTNAGNDVAVGGLTAGMIVAGYVSGSTFRLLSDQASAAIVAAAEAAADRAEAAAGALSGVEISTFATRADALAYAPVVAPTFLRTAFYDSIFQQASGATYRKVEAEPSHPGKLQIAEGSWYEIAEARLNPQMFGARRDTVGFDSYAAFRDCHLTIKTQATATNFRYGGPIYVPAGEYELSQPLVIDTPGVALVGDGAATSVLKAQSTFANAGVSQALVQHSPVDTVGSMLGSQLKGIGLDCNHISALKGYLGEIVYDQIIYDDVRVSQINGNAVGFHLRPKAGHNLDVNQTIGIRDLFVAKYTQKGTVPAVLLEGCQEVYVLGGKAWNGFGTGDDRGSQAPWFIQDCRTVVFVATSFASSLWAGIVVNAQTRDVDQVSLIDPLFENIVNPVRALVTGSFRIRNMRVVNPRFEAPVTGSFDLDGLLRGYIEVSSASCVLGSNTTTTTVLADQLSQITDNGTSNSKKSRRNAIDDWEGFAHNIRVFAGADTLLETSAPASQEVGILVALNNGTTTALRRVVVGAPDSGGTGFRMLRVAN